jgi:ferritin-like metal-binding protein YciE
LSTKWKQTEELSEEQVREQFFAGLERLYVAYGQNAAAAIANADDAQEQELKRLLQTGSRKDQEQRKRLLVVMEAAGTQPQPAAGEAEPGVLEQGRSGIIAAAEGLERDLAIIAAEQSFAQACLAEFGPLHTQARLLKNASAARHLHRMMNDTKQLEEGLGRLSTRLLKQAAAPHAQTADAAESVPSEDSDAGAPSEKDLSDPGGLETA